MLKKIVLLLLLASGKTILSNDTINYITAGFMRGCKRAYNAWKNYNISKGKIEITEASLNLSAKGLETVTVLAANAAAQQLDLAATNQSVQKVDASLNQGFQKTLEQLSISHNIQKEIDAKLVLVLIGGTVYVTYKIVYSIKSLLFPSAEQKAAKLKAQQALKLQELNSCLSKNELGKKDDNGLPCACQKVAQEFLQVAGYKKYSDLQTAFNECTKKA